MESYLHKATLDLVDGRMSVEDWLKGADRVRDEALENKPVEEVSYGTAR